MAETPVRKIRVADDLWVDFGEAARDIGSNRTRVLVAFMRRYVRAMKATAPRFVDGEVIEDELPKSG